MIVEEIGNEFEYYNIPNIISIYSKFDYSLLNIDLISTFFSDNFKGILIDTEDLQFYVKLLVDLNIDEFIVKITESSSKFDKNNNVMHKSIFLFFAVKYLTQLSEFSRISEDKLLQIIDSNFPNYSHDVLWAYKYKLFASNINICYITLTAEKEAFKNRDNIWNYIRFNIEKNINDPVYMSSFFINQVAFINFIEFLITLNANDNKFYYSQLVLNLIMTYFIWRNNIEVYRIY